MAQPQIYRVIWGAGAQQSLRKMLKIAKRPVRSGIKSILTDLDARLRNDPKSVGETYLIRGNIVESLAVVRFLSFDFAIDTARFLVLVRTCRALIGHGIDDVDQN